MASRVAPPAQTSIATPLAETITPISVPKPRLRNNSAPADDTSLFTGRVPRAVAPSAQAQLKHEMTFHLDQVASTFRLSYGPAEWKEIRYDWQIDTKIAHAKDRVDRTRDIKLPQFHTILKDLLNTTRDYHVGVVFAATESVSLPFSVTRAADTGEYVITNIDRTKLGRDNFPFEKGDTLVSFDGKPTDEAVATLLARNNGNSPLTDQSNATLKLTARATRVADVIPKEPSVTIEVRGRDGTVRSRELAWTRTEERYLPSPSAPSSRNIDPLLWKAVTRNGLMRAANIIDEPTDAAVANPWARGARRSWVPRLGTPIFETDAKNPFDAYIYKGLGGKLIGVIRIPTYSVADYTKNTAEFAKLIKHFESVTDGLVIDQVNNGGGSVAYCRALLSMLSPTALVTPKRMMTITTQDAIEADQIIQSAKNVKDDASARKLLGNDVQGYPVSYDFVQKQLAYARFLKSEYDAGKRISSPFHLDGIDAINPSTVATYTKPMMILVNEQCYSSADAVPAILQDNKRAVVVGVRTAGAGGSVEVVQIPNRLGVVQMTITRNISIRPDGHPIENLAVTPDIDVPLTADDLKNDCRTYARTINNKFARLLGVDVRNVS